MKIFLISDALGWAVAGQKVPDGYSHLDCMIPSTVSTRTRLGGAAPALDARSIGEEAPVDGVRRSTLEELTDWTHWAKKVVTF